MNEAAIEPTTTDPGITTTTTEASMKTSVSMHPLFADATTNTLAADFATRLGPDLAPYAETLNQRFGGQSIEKLAKSYGEANKMISEGGRAIGYPAPEAPPETWAKWSQANGIPETAEGYQLFPEGKEGVNPEIVAKFQKAFHDEMVPPAMAARIAARYEEIQTAAIMEAQEAYKADLDKAQGELRRQFGDGYENMMENLRGLVASQGYDPGDVELFDNPKVVGLIAKFSKMLGEDTVASLRNAAVTTGAFRGDPVAEAKRIMNDPNHPDHAAYLIAGPNDPIAMRVQKMLGG